MRHCDCERSVAGSNPSFYDVLFYWIAIPANSSKQGWAGTGCGYAFSQ
ncbi:MAG: hypothetical protein ABL867_02495 [Rickettsiales bacterium]